MSEAWDGKNRRKADRRKPPPWDGYLHLPNREVNLRPALPLRVVDWKVLKKSGITLNALQEAAKDTDVESMVALVLHVAVKATPTVTADDIEQLTFLELVGAVNNILSAEAGDVDRPT